MRKEKESTKVQEKRLEELKSRLAAGEKDEEEKTKMLQEVKAERDGELKEGLHSFADRLGATVDTVSFSAKK